MEYKPDNTDWFLKNNLAPPETTGHGTEEDIREKLKPLKTWGWKLEGNMLSCMTDMGPLTQSIPPNYICLGDDKDGKPILKAIEI